MKLFCFGFGYSATALADILGADRGIAIAGTRTRAGPNIAAFQADAHSDAQSAEVVRLLDGATHVLVSIPPGVDGCSVLRHFEADLASLQGLTWVGYLSTVGVYGDADGGWVDEDTPIRPTSERALRRALAEAAWQRFGDATGKRVEVFRLPGIYGPGRSVLDTLSAGTAKRMVKPGQVFNRIHVADIAGALARAMTTPTTHRIYNITDNEPSPPQDVVAFGAALLGLPAPSEVAFDATRLSPMAASFYAENKRVRNLRMTQALCYTLLYPTYREGLRSIAGQV